ncbi:hypothetical protein EI555_002085, partial [Monodon monoceros]
MPVLQTSMPRGASASVFEALKIWDSDRTQYIKASQRRRLANLTEMDGPEAKSEFGMSATVGCPLLPVPLELLRGGPPALLKSSCNWQFECSQWWFSRWQLGDRSSRSFLLVQQTSRKPRALEWRFATTLKNVTEENEGKAVTNEGHEEGFAPNILENKEAPEHNQESQLHKQGCNWHSVAASQFFRFGKHVLDFKSPEEPSRYIFPEQQVALYKSSLRDWYCLSKTASEHIDWEAWTKFIAGE